MKTAPKVWGGFIHLKKRLEAMDYIEKAFQKVKRANFIPKDLKAQANIDAPLPLGFGQTISQPTTVRMMLEWLEPQIDNKILDVGSGSGWTSALLSNLVGPRGKIYAVEIIPELLKFGRDNCQKLGIKNIKFYKASQEYGLTKFAPYDRILVNAASPKLPMELLRQLQVNGKMVIPVHHDVLEITKQSEENYEVIKHPGFVFVPLV